jgi:hypothetical protein
MFLVFACLQAALFVWLLKIRRETGAKAAAVLLVPQFFLIWDNARVAAGYVLGFGDLLYWLTWPAFWAHWLTGCWLIIASGSILKIAGFKILQHKWVMGSFCLVATALIIHDLPLFWTKELYPVCDFDLIRYSTSINELNRCSPDQELIASVFPLAPLITCLIVIGSGMAIWMRHGLPWMMIGGVVMLTTAAVPVLSYHRLDNLGEVFIAGGAILTIYQLHSRGLTKS